MQIAKLVALALTLTATSILSATVSSRRTPRAWCRPHARSAARRRATPPAPSRRGTAGPPSPAKAGFPTFASPGARRRPNDKPLFKITAANAGQYADRLTEGDKALLRGYPARSS